MNPIGASTWIWTSPLTDQAVATLAPHVAAMGFDALELPVENNQDWDPVRASEVLQHEGLRSSICAVMSPGRDLLVDDRIVVASTQAYLRRCVDVAAAVGAHLVGGPIYAATGRTWHLESGERRSVVRRLVDRLRPVSEYAGERGIRIALEPLNRFETSVVNTAEQAMEIVERLDHRSCGVLLDTFHMNIEERDPPAAIRSCAGRLLHFHASGCDRGAPGSDHIGWAGLSRALAAVGYRGMLCIESFTVQNRAIARAASIWRPLALSPDALAGEGLRFLRALG